MIRVFVKTLQLNKTKTNLLNLNKFNFQPLKYFTSNKDPYSSSSSGQDKSTTEKIKEKVSSTISDSADKIKDKMSDSADKLKEKVSDKMSGSGGQSSQSGGTSTSTSQQSYATSDPMGTYNYMKVQEQEGFGQCIDKLIIADHTLIKATYEKFKSAKSNEDAAKWRNELVYEIARHSIAEELILYPLMRDTLPDGETLFHNSITEHKHVKQHLYEAQHVEFTSSEFKQKVNEVMELLIAHIDKEEKEILPQIIKHIDEEKRIKAGNQFSRRKLIVPTRPHTMIPEDYPTINSILGLLTAPIDKFRDLFLAFPDQNKMADIKKEASSHASSSSTSKDSDNKH